MIRLLVGPPCAGKTTYIENHAKTGDIRLDWDKLAEALDAKETGTHADRDGAVRAVASYARVVLGHYVRTRWKAETDTGREATCWIPVTTPAAVGGLEDYISAGGRVTLVDPGKAACLRRAREDGRPARTIDAIEAWYNDPPTIPDSWIYQDEEKGAPPMRAKNLDVKVKATSGEAYENPFGGDLEDGDFIAYASTFHNDPDSYGDIIQPGAFAHTLAEWAEKDTPIPLLYGHRTDDPDMNIGHIVEAREDDTGLLVWGRIDLECEKGRQAHRLIKSRRLNQLSFAFDALDWEPLKEGGHLLKELALHEVSLVQFGANRHTSVLAVKTAADVVQTVKGEFTDEEHEHLTDAVDTLREALAELEKLLATTGEENQDNTEDTAEGAREQDEPAEPETGSAKARIAAASLALALANTTTI